MLLTRIAIVLTDFYFDASASTVLYRSWYHHCFDNAVPCCLILQSQDTSTNSKCMVPFDSYPNCSIWPKTLSAQLVNSKAAHGILRHTAICANNSTFLQLDDRLGCCRHFWTLFEKRTRSAVHRFYHRSLFNLYARHTCFKENVYKLCESLLRSLEPAMRYLLPPSHE